MNPRLCNPSQHGALPIASRLQPVRNIWTDLSSFPQKITECIDICLGRMHCLSQLRGAGKSLMFCKHPILHPPKMQHYGGEDVFWFVFAVLFQISMILVAFAVGQQYEQFGVFYLPGRRIQNSAFPLGHTDHFLPRSGLFAGLIVPTIPVSPYKSLAMGG